MKLRNVECLLHFIARAEGRTGPPMWAWAIFPEPKDVGLWCLHPLISLRDEETALGGLLSHTTEWAVPAPAPATSCVKRQPDAAMFCAAQFFSSARTLVRPERAGSGVDSWPKAQNLKSGQEAMLTQPGPNRWWWPIDFLFWNLNWEISTDRDSQQRALKLSANRHRVGLRLMASKWWGSRPAENGKEAHYLWCISFYLGMYPSWAIYSTADVFLDCCQFLSITDYAAVNTLYLLANIHID